MRAYHKIFLIILFFAYLVSPFQFVFAQNLDDLKLDIYSKLRDRLCTTMSLDKCNCPAAKEMKAYIDALLETGTSKEEIFYKVAKRFSLNTILDAQIRQDVEKRLVKEAGESRPQISLEPTSFDFGKISREERKIGKIFKLYNRGSSPLIITNLKTSCACATILLRIDKNKTPYFGTAGAKEDLQIELAPNKGAELEIVFDLFHPSVKTGHLIREATIFSNDPIYPEVTIKVEADVTE